MTILSIKSNLIKINHINHGSLLEDENGTSRYTTFTSENVLLTDPLELLTIRDYSSFMEKSFIHANHLDCRKIVIVRVDNFLHDSLKIKTLPEGMLQAIIFSGPDRRSFELVKIHKSMLTEDNSLEYYDEEMSLALFALPEFSLEYSDSIEPYRGRYCKAVRDSRFMNNHENSIHNPIQYETWASIPGEDCNTVEQIMISRIDERDHIISNDIHNNTKNNWLEVIIHDDDNISDE